MTALSVADVQRFWRKIQKTDGCWLWIGSRGPSGYGLFGVATDSGRWATNRAHRFSWEIHNGPIPPGMCVCHHCDNPPCVRPDHLFLGTHKDNSDDMIRKGRGAFGEKHPRAILDWETVRRIRREYDGTLTGRVELANRFGVTERAINSIVRGFIWKEGARPVFGTPNAAKTHCKRGHEFTPENTRLRPSGGRTCRACHRAKIGRAHV